MLKLGTKNTFTAIANWATLIAAAYLIVEYANDKEAIKNYNVDCNLWQPPTGGENCELCNDENTPCSEYRCHSLGASCSLVNEGTANETCVSLYVNDVNSPIIEPIEDTMKLQELTITPTTDEGDKGYEVNEKIKAFTPVTFAINTDEPAICKYSAEVGLEYDTMNNYFGPSIYVYDHEMTVSLTDDLTDEQLLELTQGVYTIYIRCADAMGNANERDYFIRFTVDTTPDLTPPEVKYTSINIGSYMAYGVNETEFSLYTNEPAQCRWNMNDTGYDFMSGEMKCASSGFQQSSVYYGTYECSTTLTGVSKSEINYFYFRCKDNYENVNEESYKFSTKMTEDPLVISEISPNGTLYDTSVTLEVVTEDGADNGDAVCAFSNENVDFYNMVVFAVTNSSKNTQTLELSEGDYTYYIICQDIAGNRASNKTTFKIEVDTNAPVIDSLYVDLVYSELYLSLDEEANCEYAPESFTYGEGTAMNSEASTEQYASLDSTTYYIICVDKYNNYGSYYIDLSAWV